MEQDEENPVADVMPDKLREYLAAQGQVQGRPMYASNDDSPMAKAAQSIKGAFGTPEANAGVSDFKQKPVNPYQNFANVAAGSPSAKYFYSKSQNKTKIVYPDGKEELVDGRIQPK